MCATGRSGDAMLADMPADLIRSGLLSDVAQYAYAAAVPRALASSSSPGHARWTSPVSRSGPGTTCARLSSVSPTCAPSWESCWPTSPTWSVPGCWSRARTSRISAPPGTDTGLPSHRTTRRAHSWASPSSATTTSSSRSKPSPRSAAEERCHRSGIAGRSVGSVTGSGLQHRRVLGASSPRCRGSMHRGPDDMRNDDASSQQGGGGLTGRNGRRLSPGIGNTAGVSRVESSRRKFLDLKLRKPHTGP